jgi:hypothetical protein
VAHKQFDRIVAHPPYIPAGAGEFVYRDGGEDGEQVVRRVIGGLETHLRPGGSFYGLVLASDRRDAPLEMRIRRFLGDGNGRFDVVLGVIRTYTIPERLGEFAGDPRRPGKEIEALRRRCDALGVEAFVYGVTVIRRREKEGGPPVTSRRTRGQACVSWPFDWLVQVESMRMSEPYRFELPDRRPQLSAHVTVHVQHGIENGDWVASAFRIVTSLPFELDTPCPAWVPALLARCDGGSTVTELFRGLQADGLIPRDSRLEAFLELIDRLVGWGVLGLDGAALGTDSLSV